LHFKHHDFSSFQAPKPAEDWDGVLDTTKDDIPVCMQFELFSKTVEGTEDCLVLNVFTPAIQIGQGETSEKLPVMVWIHGGGYVVGDSKTALFGPGYLIDKDVIMVSMNYRLGALGKTFSKYFL
jgi:carboxylesterase type B